MNERETAAILRTPDRRSNRTGQEHTATETNSLGDGEGIRINPAFRTGGTTAPADRGDELREIATNLERLCIEYACHSRINGVGSETRAAWSAFKAQIERLKGAA